MLSELRGRDRASEERPGGAVKVVCQTPYDKTFDVQVPSIVGLDLDTADKLACGVSRAFREAGVEQDPTIVLEGEDVAVAQLTIGDTVKAIDFMAESEVLAEVKPSERDREDPKTRETLLSIGDGEVLMLDFEQAWVLQTVIELLSTIEPLIDRPESFYYDDDRFNQLYMRLHDATAPAAQTPGQ